MHLVARKGLAHFTCVDLFGFRPRSDRIDSMHIVYDTHPLRERVGDKYAPTGSG